MGGTSTDVCHFSGSYERTYKSQISGVRLSSPMMNINTVAKEEEVYFLIGWVGCKLVLKVQVLYQVHHLMEMEDP